MQIKFVLGKISYEALIKTQILFSNRPMFSGASFARVRKKKDCSDSCIVMIFGLEHKAESPRIDVVMEPHSNRWTHHILISERAGMKISLLFC